MNISSNNGGDTLQIYSKNIYETVENKIKQNIVIVYNISGNHYVGLPIHNNQTNDSIHISSINKYVIPSELTEYAKKNIKRISIC